MDTSLQHTLYTVIKPNGPDNKNFECSEALPHLLFKKLKTIFQVPLNLTTSVVKVEKEVDKLTT